jgi:hypothetical protein
LNAITGVLGRTAIVVSLCVSRAVVSAAGLLTAGAMIALGEMPDEVGCGWVPGLSACSRLRAAPERGSFAEVSAGDFLEPPAIAERCRPEARDTKTQTHSEPPPHAGSPPSG